MDYKPAILSELEALRRVSIAEPAGGFKSRAYTSAIKTIQAIAKITSIDDIPGSGIGKGLREKIERIITEGSHLSTEVRAKASALDTLTGVYGIGPKKAQSLITEHGITTIAELRLLNSTNSKLLNKNQRIGLDYYEQLLERIPRSEMQSHELCLMTHKPRDLDGLIVGSYRRGQPDSGDIDMLLTCAGSGSNSLLGDFAKALKKIGYIREILAQGEHKCMAICQLEGAPARRLDLLITPRAEFPFAVFYFTGCDTFNVSVRSHALTRGYTLNEHALTRVADGQPVGDIKTEEDIFKALNLAWIPPEQRTGSLLHG